MTNQELIQEAAVIRDERNQYANTAERVGTALVHMAEQIAAQGDDVDKIEAEVRGALTLAQLDNPLGFTTNMQWVQGLNEDKSYTFRLVDTSGRCIGHVWLLNDADYPSDRSVAARFLEVAMCCASIDSETGALTTDARWGSPRIYYRTYCTQLSGGTPDGGYPSGIFKWSSWQEYRDYVANPIKDALAALQQQHATDVADLQADIDAAVAAIPTGVLNLGMKDNADTILSEAAKYAVASDPFKAVITGQYMVGTAVQSIVIHQQVTKSSDGSGVCMQYVYKDKARFTRYINFNAAASVTAVQRLQPDGVRNLYYTDTGFIGQRDPWGTQVGSGFFLPNKNDLREGTPTATSVPLVLTKAIKDTVTCKLGPATTARAGVMTVGQVERLAAIEEKTDRLRDLGNYSTIGELDNAAYAIVGGSGQMGVRDLPLLMYGTVGYDNTVIYMQTVEDSAFPCIWQVRMYENGGAGLMQRRIILDEDDFEHDTLVPVSLDEFTSFIPDRITAEQDSDELRLQLRGLDGSAAMGGKCILNAATSQKAGIMSSVQVNSLGALSNMWLEIDEEFAAIEDILYYFQGHPDVALNDNYKFFRGSISNDDSSCNMWGMKSVRILENTLAHVGLYVFYGERYDVFEVAFYRQDEQSAWEEDETAIYTPISGVSINTTSNSVSLVLNYSSEYVSDGKIPIPNADAYKPGMMTPAHVQKLANLEARIAALEAK